MAGVGEMIGEMIASAVVKQIVSKLNDLVTREVILQWRYKDEVVKISSKMKDLETVMHDADNKLRRGGIEGEAVGRWLVELKSVADDIDDVLEELHATELIKQIQPKVELFFSRDNQLLHRLTMPHKIKIISKRIHELNERGIFLQLVPHQSLSEGSRTRNNETFAAISSQGMETGIVGRDKEKNKIISLLLRPEANEEVISIVPIIGLGGIGKTTLAETVLADKRVNIFGVQVWVHVSMQFDLYKIASAIMKRVNSNVNLDNCTLQFLHDNLKAELSTVRYLIVLDDLWEEDRNKLEELKRMLQHGKNGSRIIVTTRSQSVVKSLHAGFLANIICPVPESDQINLGFLSPTDCWEVMKQRAFRPGAERSASLEEIGIEIAKKCGGLPLAAKALGQIMYELPTVQAWEEIRDTNIGQTDALECLKLSYNYMKLEYKMCFTYLSVFSKGFIMNSSYLIQQWMALGYIRTKNDGQRCMNYLLGMSFLQISRPSSVSLSAGHVKYLQELTMHDVVHDLARIVAGNELIILDATMPSTRNQPNHRNCRHAQLINYHNQSISCKELPGKVRSVHFRNSGNLQLPRKAFSKSRHIRVLDLSGYPSERQSIPSNIALPSSIGQLKLLRYLDATCLPITSLPKSFHTLQNMETIILSNCAFETLPDNICCLGKLCYLDLSGNSSLNKLPISLGDLSELNFLNLSGCSILQELPETICEHKCLRHLDMSDCCALQKLPDKFSTFPKLSFLNLSGCSRLTKLPDNISFPCLEHLDLSSCHELRNLPNNFGNLGKLEFLDLSSCYNIKMVSESFCQLHHLIYLNLSDCHNLNELPEHFGNLFRLEYLNLTSCSKLQFLPDSLCNLLKLRHLDLSYCMRLTKLPSLFGDLKLQFLDINGLRDLTDLPDSIGDMTSITQFMCKTGPASVIVKARAILERLNLSGRAEHSVHIIENRGYSSIVKLAGLTCSELILRDLQNVKHPEDAERVKLHDKLDIQVLALNWLYEGGKSQLEKLIPPRSIEQLVINGYMSKDFPNWMSHVSSYLPCLTTLILDGLGGCDCLPPFGGLPNLRSLIMVRLPNVSKVGKEFYGEGRPCRKLRMLKLKLMENLVEWWTTKSGEEDEKFLIPDLHDLQIMDCQHLKFLPYPPRSMLWHVENSSQVLPERGFGKLSCSTLPSEMAIKNCNLFQDKWDRLQHFPTLEIFYAISINGLRRLPEVVRCFTSLTKLSLVSLKSLEALPEWLGDLGSLVEIVVQDCCNVTYLPQSMKNLTALRVLRLQQCNSLEVLPGWLGQLTSLEVLYILACPILTSLPASIGSLATLKELHIWRCPRVVPYCQDEDAQKICHIAKVILYSNEVELMRPSDCLYPSQRSQSSANRLRDDTL